MENKEVITNEEIEKIKLTIHRKGIRITRYGLWALGLGLLFLMINAIMLTIPNGLHSLIHIVCYSILGLAIIVVFFSLHKLKKNNEMFEQSINLYKERETHSDAPLSKKDVMLKLGLWPSRDIEY